MLSENRSRRYIFYLVQESGHTPLECLSLQDMNKYKIFKKQKQVTAAATQRRKQKNLIWWKINIINNKIIRIQVEFKKKKKDGNSSDSWSVCADEDVDLKWTSK